MISNRNRIILYSLLLFISLIFSFFALVWPKLFMYYSLGRIYLIYTVTGIIAVASALLYIRHKRWISLFTMIISVIYIAMLEYWNILLVNPN
jgi:hypothetical protein